MRVRVRLHLNVCVSCRMRESWQLWQKWALGTLQFYLTLYLYSSSSPSDALNIMCITLPCFIPSPFPSFSSLLHPLLTFLLLPSSLSLPSPLFSQGSRHRQRQKVQVVVYCNYQSVSPAPQTSNWSTEHVQTLMLRLMRVQMLRFQLTRVQVCLCGLGINVSTQK